MVLEARGCNPSACLRAQGLPQAGAAALPGVRGVGSSERSRPGGRSSGARGDGSGHGESRAEAETLPGALDYQTWEERRWCNMENALTPAPAVKSLSLLITILRGQLKLKAI